MKRELLRGTYNRELFAVAALAVLRVLPIHAQTVVYRWAGPVETPGPLLGDFPDVTSAVESLDKAFASPINESCSATTRAYSLYLPDPASNFENEIAYGLNPETFSSGCIPLGPLGPTSEAFLVPTSLKTSNFQTSLIDPVPSEVNASGVVADANALASSSTIVVGIAADGAAEIVIRIATPSAGTAIQLSLADESGTLAAAGSGIALGYLTTLLPSDGAASTVNGQPITVASVPVPSGGSTAFAVYYAPKDFVRDGNSRDPSLGTRNVYVEVSVGGKVQTMQTIEILRPPVVFIHGIWGTGVDGDRILSSLQTDGIGVTTYSIDYASPIAIASSTPSYGSNLTVNGDNLGFQFAANTVLPELYDAIADYRTNNTLGQQIAVSRADIVAHSMGGDVARYLPLMGAFLKVENYELGPLHKLITIGTPHLGSPLATQLVQASNACVQQVLATAGRYAFLSVQTPSGISYDGGVADLEGDVNGTPSSLSPALTSIQPSTSSATVTIPTGLIAASMTSAQLNAVNSSALALIIRNVCSPAPLAVDLTADNWPSLVSSQSDAIVPANSQLAGSSSNTEFFLAGDIHSPGTEDLGFAGPSELDDIAVIPPEVLQLLNTPVDNQSVFISLP